MKPSFRVGAAGRLGAFASGAALAAAFQQGNADFVDAGRQKQEKYRQDATLSAAEVLAAHLKQSKNFFSSDKFAHTTLSI